MLNNFSLTKHRAQRFLVLKLFTLRHEVRRRKASEVNFLPFEYSFHPSITFDLPLGSRLLMEFLGKEGRYLMFAVNATGS